MAGFFDRALRKVGLQRVSAAAEPAFKGGTINRLNLDWAVAMLSADQKIRRSLVQMRQRCRQLADNNDYAKRFLNKARENVIGSNGVGLQIVFDADQVPQAETIANKIESAWLRWCERCSADGRMSLIDLLQLATVTKLQDGEVFLRYVKGYPYNATRFALQPIDADQLDVQYNLLPRTTADGQVTNEIAMSVEFDEWRRPVAYWMWDGHPTEKLATKRLRVPAEEILQDYVFQLVNQTRGVPWMHTAMTRMNMLGGFQEATLVGARLAACKMAAIQQKSEGDNYGGEREAKTGAVEIDVEPASMFQLPSGTEIKPIDWNYPNVVYADFERAMLRGVSVGMNVSYSTLAGDLRDVNFSSLRQGVLDEREGWKLLQTSAVRQQCQPIFAQWLAMSVLTGQLELPARFPLEMVREAARWTPRGWDWVDPEKDVRADMLARGAAMSTLAAICAKRGLDWRDVIDQIARENEYAASKGVELNFAPAATQTPNESENDNGGGPPAGASLVKARL